MTRFNRQDYCQIELLSDYKALFSIESDVHRILKKLISPCYLCYNITRLGNDFITFPENCLNPLAPALKYTRTHKDHHLSKKVEKFENHWGIQVESFTLSYIKTFRFIHAAFQTIHQ